MENLTQHDELGVSPEQETQKRPGVLSVNRTIWIWTTGLAITATSALRLIRLTYPDPFACAKPDVVAPGRETILTCTFYRPIVPLDDWMFGGLYIWVFVSLLAALAGMRWRAARMVLAMTLTLAAADFASQVIYDYFR